LFLPTASWSPDIDRHATLPFMSNLWERAQNKRARLKKARAKQHGSLTSTKTSFMPSIEKTGEDYGVVVGIGGKITNVQFHDKILSSSTDDNIQLTVGDHVQIDLADAQSPRIVGRYTRHNVVARMRGDWARNSLHVFEEHVLAANVDCGVIVVSAKDPAFHPRFIDRYLITLESGNITPFICITKSDLASKIDEVKELYGSLEIPVYEISIITGAGMDSLKDALRSKTAVFLGHSGVGKSSLLRAFIPEADIRTQEVSKKTGTGKHTTTGSKMYEWAPDSFIIDTPGIRSLGVNTIPKNQLRFFFHEFDRPAQLCRFRDCLHDKEEDCAVKEAVTEGTVNRARYNSYLRMLNEK